MLTVFPKDMTIVVLGLLNYYRDNEGDSNYDDNDEDDLKPLLMTTHKGVYPSKAAWDHSL